MYWLSYIIWSANPKIFPASDFIQVRWYGLMFAIGFLVSQQIMFYIFRKEKKSERDVETLTIFMVIATIIGARLGHVLFYEPEKYLPNPIDIFKIWEGGLASHGAAIGIILALYMYSNYYINISFKKFTWKRKKREGQSVLWILDRIVIVVALTGCLIRLGNFINSEIIGKPTDSDYGVVFARQSIDNLLALNEIDDVEVVKSDKGDTTKYVPLTFILYLTESNAEEKDIRLFLENNMASRISRGYASDHVVVPGPLDYTLEQDKGVYVAKIEALGISRYPAQLYESFTCILLFAFLFFLWNRKKEKTPEGQLFGLFLILLFGMRFFHEILKENQVAFENDIPLNMGQWLSIPLVIVGVIILLRSSRKAEVTA